MADIKGIEVSAETYGLEDETSRSGVSSNATSIGTLADLTTTEKTNLVGAINEVKSSADTNKTSIGTLADLTTTEKTNLVGAINEVKSLIQPSGSVGLSLANILNQTIYSGDYFSLSVSQIRTALGKSSTSTYPIVDFTITVISSVGSSGISAMGRISGSYLQSYQVVGGTTVQGDTTFLFHNTSEETATMSFSIIG